jgi:hypothetical protein
VAYSTRINYTAAQKAEMWDRNNVRTIGLLIENSCSGSFTMKCIELNGSGQGASHEASFDLTLIFFYARPR